MKIRLFTCGLAMLAPIALLPPSATWAQNSASDSRSDAQLSPARQAIHWSQDRLSEFDAAIASLEQDVAKHQTDARANAEALLNDLRSRRDAYRIKAEEAVANMAKWTDAQVADARKSLDEAGASFQAKVDEYLDAVNADAGARRAVLEAELAARQKELQNLVDQLRTDADKLAAKQKAEIDTRIDGLKADMDVAKARIGRLQEASRQGWDAVKRDFEESGQRFSDTFSSIRDSMKEAVE